MGKRWFCKALKAGRWHSYCPYLWRTLFKTKRDFRAGLGDFGHEQPSRGENKPWLTKCLFTGCAVHLHAASQQVFVWEGNIWYPSAPVWIHSFKFFLRQSWSCCPSFCDRAVRAVQHIMQMGTHAPSALAALSWASWRACGPRCKAQILTGIFKALVIHLLLFSVSSQCCFAFPRLSWKCPLSWVEEVCPAHKIGVSCQQGGLRYKLS